MPGHRRGAQPEFDKEMGFPQIRGPQNGEARGKVKGTWNGNWDHYKVVHREFRVSIA